MEQAAWQFAHEVECNVHPAQAWAFWTDVSNWERLEGEAVEWIRLEGPFAEGSTGVTKMPGLPPQSWQIEKVVPGRSATIAITLEGATYRNRMVFEPVPENATRIIQVMSLTGEKAEAMAAGMTVFEESAPQGLKKLVGEIEAWYPTG